MLRRLSAGRVAGVCGMVAAGLMLVACQGLGGSKAELPLIPDARSPVTDVPVPAGFTMGKDSTSKVVYTNALRVVDQRYTGSDDLLPVVRYFKDQLPQRGWEPVTQTQPSGKEVILQFASKSRGEECTITVRRRMFDTQIRLRIDPVARAGQ